MPSASETNDRAEYSVKCLYPRCPFSKSYGAARLRAEIEAGKHARRFDWHQVQVRRTVVLHTFTARDNQTAFPNLEIGEENGAAPF
jgi:hypothetical protein